VSSAWLPFLYNLIDASLHLIEWLYMPDMAHANGRTWRPSPV